MEKEDAFRWYGLDIPTFKARVQELFNQTASMQAVLEYCQGLTTFYGYSSTLPYESMVKKIQALPFEQRLEALLKIEYLNYKFQYPFMGGKYVPIEQKTVDNILGEDLTRLAPYLYYRLCGSVDHLQHSLQIKDDSFTQTLWLIAVLDAIAYNSHHLPEFYIGEIAHDLALLNLAYAKLKQQLIWGDPHRLFNLINYHRQTLAHAQKHINQKSQKQQ